MSENKIIFNLESRFKKPVDLLVKLFKDHEFLIPLSYQMSKYKYEFWHMVTVPMSYKGTIDSLKQTGQINAETFDYLETGTAAAHLHDIGKFGIVRGSIDKSLEVMNYVNFGFVPSATQKDGRPPEIRSIQHLHPLVGGYAIGYLIEVGLIPPEIGEKIKSGVFSHHETPKNSFKPPYPRRENGRRLKGRDPRQVLSDFLIMLTDAAVSMRSIRPYRSHELDYPIIENELDFYLQDEELIQYIKPLFKESDTDLKSILKTNIMASVKDIDHLIRDVPNLTGIDWNGYHDTPEEIKLENIIENVWVNNWGAIQNAYEKEYERDFVHQTRVV